MTTKEMNRIYLKSVFINMSVDLYVLLNDNRTKPCIELYMIHDCIQLQYQKLEKKRMLGVKLTKQIINLKEMGFQKVGSTK